MRIDVNGTPREIAAASVAEALNELGFDPARVATAVNGAFVPGSARATRALTEGDRLEVLAPMQGG